MTDHDIPELVENLLEECTQDGDVDRLIRFAKLADKSARVTCCPKRMKPHIENRKHAYLARKRARELQESELNS